MFFLLLLLPEQRTSATRKKQSCSTIRNCKWRNQNRIQSLQSESCLIKRFWKTKTSKSQKPFTWKFYWDSFLDRAKRNFNNWLKKQEFAIHYSHKMKPLSRDKKLNKTTISHRKCPSSLMYSGTFLKIAFPHRHNWPNHKSKNYFRRNTNEKIMQRGQYQNYHYTYLTNSQLFTLNRIYRSHLLPIITLIDLNIKHLPWNTMNVPWILLPTGHFNLKLQKKKM